MKLVTFGKPMAPHGVGDTRLVPDDVARQLQSDGVLSASEPWPARASAPAAARPARSVLKPGRPTGGADQRFAR